MIKHYKIFILILTAQFFCFGLLSFAYADLGQYGELCCKKDNCAKIPGKAAVDCADALAEPKCDDSKGLECQCVTEDDLCAISEDADTGERISIGKAVGVCAKKDETVICPFGPGSIQEIIDTITKWVFYLAVIIAPLLIVVGALMILTSQGDPAKVSKARRLITYAAIGLALILFSRAIYGLIKNIIGFK